MSYRVPMQRFHQALFLLSILGWSWFGMMAIHELGHVLGAFLTGGTVERVVLHPLTISRTDVAPNPHPAVVVWLGPLLGCLLPLLLLTTVPRRLALVRNIAMFFAGFCLIANGSYISIGAFDRVGDCGEMLRTGTPLWVMLVFGGVTVPLGLYLWHRLGSIKQLVENPSVVSARTTYIAFLSLLLVASCAAMVLPR
ncbi:MAG: M50 family metallopeptidase [Pirellulales bacterium]|nr:M50 family metallopeptidase [Pirellulales bacterium]